MTPNDLAEEFEKHDYNYFLNKMLNAVPENIDKREGSVIFDAVAPAAMVMAQQSLNMAYYVRETYIKTAEGEFLDYRAVEHGTARYAATHTEVKAKMLDDDQKPLTNVNIGDRFASIGETPFFYKVIKANDDGTFELQAEAAGSGPNSYLGQILPVTPNDALSWAEIIEITVPARDNETDDHLRQRLLNSSEWIAYGGNVADYIDMVSKITDVGAVQVYPVWNGPGTVKLVIVNNDLMPASETLIHKVKEEIDPEDKETLGYGLAPIDHRVTVAAPTIRKVNVQTTIKVDSQHASGPVKTQVQAALENFFKTLRGNWANVDPVAGRGYSQVVNGRKSYRKLC